MMLQSRPSAAFRAGFLGLSMLLSGTALAQEAVTIRFVQTNDIDRMSPEKGRGGFAKLGDGGQGREGEGQCLLRPCGRHDLALAPVGLRQGRPHHRHPEPHGRRRHGAGQPRIRSRRRSLPRPHGRGQVRRARHQHRRRQRPAGQHQARQDGRGAGRQDRLLRPHHRGRRRSRRAPAPSSSPPPSTRPAPRRRNCARRAPTSSSPSPTRRSKWT